MSDFYVVLSLAVYVAIAAAFVTETYMEGERAGGHWDESRVLGLGMCVIWPVLACAVAAAAIWSSKPLMGLKV
ncbi:hypothetical protein [Rhizobium rosettiformans]|nr:hypothetical protein [Rhizobium rosettiformans]